VYRWEVYHSGGGANGTSDWRLRREYTARGTNEELCLATSYFSFTHGNRALAGYKDLGTFWSEITPEAR
jgi:hypothetical protein